MIFTSVPDLKSITRSASIALGLVLATTGCSDSGVVQTESDSTARPDSEEAEASHTSNDTPGIVGTMMIDRQPYDLTLSYWCEPEEGFESGTTVAIRVGAYDESGDVIVYGLQVDGDESDSTVSSISAATDPSTNYSSKGLTNEPTLVMENGAARLQGDVYRPGRDPVVLEAKFSLPDEPGFPGYC